MTIYVIAPRRTCKILHLLSPPAKPLQPRPARRDVLQRGFRRELFVYTMKCHMLAGMAFFPEPPQTPSPCQATLENRPVLRHFQAPTKQPTAITDSTSCKGENHKSLYSSPFCCRTSLFTRPATFESSRGFGASLGDLEGSPSCEGVPPTGVPYPHLSVYTSRPGSDNKNQHMPPNLVTQIKCMKFPEKLRKNSSILQNIMYGKNANSFVHMHG